MIAGPKRIVLHLESLLLVRPSIFAKFKPDYSHKSTDSERFSNGFNWLTDQIHSLGLCVMLNNPCYIQKLTPGDNRKAGIV